MIRGKRISVCHVLRLVSVRCAPSLWLLESSSNYDGNGNENVTKQWSLISKTMPLHFGTFLCRSLQNNNVKSPNEEREHTSVKFSFSV